jgi:hypothetical protein
MKYFILAFCLSFISCMTETESVANNGLSADYDHTKQDVVSVSLVKYIPLETIQSSLIASIDKFLYSKGLFYILDKKQNSIFMFNKEGKFLSSIKKGGEGPGEYIELKDMDIDNDGNVYIADNGRMQIIKYKKGHPEQYKIIQVNEHFNEFCYLNDHLFVLMDVFGPKKRKMKLALFDSNKMRIKPILVDKQEEVDELSILRCSKNYLYRSNNHIYYNDRYTPTIYSIDKDGSLHEAFQILSDKYILHSELKKMENNIPRFIQDKKHIKDLISIYETDSLFICMPFITSSDEYMCVQKSDVNKSFRVKLTSLPELSGIILPIIGVVNNYFVAYMNCSERNKNRRSKMDENPVLVLFTIAQGS